MSEKNSKSKTIENCLLVILMNIDETLFKKLASWT